MTINFSSHDSSHTPNNKRPKRSMKQIFAILCIVILVSMYLLNLVLALIGSEYTQNLLKGTMAMTIALPIILYGMLVVMKGADSFLKKPEDELSDEEKAGYYQMIAQRDEQRYQERKQIQEQKRAQREAKKTRK